MERGLGDYWKQPAVENSYGGRRERMMPGEDTKIAGRIKERNGSECTGSSKGGGVYGRVSRLDRLVSRAPR